MGCVACGRKRDQVSLFQKVQNASGAVKRAAMAYVRGRPVFSDEELVIARLNVCMNCPRRKSRGNECLECGCKIDLKVKINTERCPISKWEAYEPK